MRHTARTPTWLRNGRTSQGRLDDQSVMRVATLRDLGGSISGALQAHNPPSRFYLSRQKPNDITQVFDASSHQAPHIGALAAKVKS